MKYRCGVYGGSFNPLHIGHVRCIIEAANQCERLIVVLSIGENRNEISMRVRYRWLYSITKHINNIQIFVLSDVSATKVDYTENYWRADADNVKSFAREQIDVVFCGNDYDENSFWTKCYPDSKLIIFPRDEISSTKIRMNPLAHWDWLPNVVRPYYTKKVLIIGSESTGKTTLAINLAHYYNTNYLEEVGREISERSGTDMLMLEDDFTDILLQHKVKEIETLKNSNRVLFEDTDCLITLFYLHFLKSEGIQKNAALAETIAKLNDYDLIIFLEPDVKFVQDGDRSEIIAADREKYSNEVKELYRRFGFDFHSVSGDYQERFLQAVTLVDQILLSK